MGPTCQTQKTFCSIGILTIQTALHYQNFGHVLVLVVTKFFGLLGAQFKHMPVTSGPT